MESESSKNGFFFRHSIRQVEAPPGTSSLSWIDWHRGAGYHLAMFTDEDGEPILKTIDSAARQETLTKTDLIEEVSRVVEIPHRESAVIVERILDSTVHAIERGDKVEIRGFGSFRARARRARVGRNPKTGARVEVPAKRIPFFKASKELQQLIQKCDP
jgi:integration host factor subunit beta